MEKSTPLVPNHFIKNIEPVAETYAYCLIKNHFHLLIRVRMGWVTQPGQTFGVLTPKLVMQQFSNFFNAYTKAFNKAYNRTGALFQNALAAF
jgi:hypothetical protein